MNLPIKINLPHSFFQQETRCDFLITPKTKDLWAVLLDLLVEFDRVCKKNGLTFFLDSGTLLGAARHKGFIPWDDDIDVIMLRADYEKLCSIAGTEFAEPYFWQTNYTDPGSARRHGQLRNSLTTAILTDEMLDNHPIAAFNQGVFLDVFILDEVPDDENELEVFRQKLQWHINVLWELKTLFNKYREPWIEQALDEEMRVFDDVVKQYNNTGQSRVANMSLNPQRKVSSLFPKTYFDEVIDYPFEQYHFSCPKNTPEVLTGFYGNWVQFEKGTGWHGNIFLDLHNSYKKYVSQIVNPPAEKHPLITAYEQRNEAWKDCEFVKSQLKKSEELLQTEHEQLQKTQERLMSECDKIAQIESELAHIRSTKTWKIASALKLVKP